MKLTVVVHQAEEGGFWAEVPAIPGCASQGETYDELLRNIHEAIEGCLAVDLTDLELSGTDRIVEIAVRKLSAESASAEYSSRGAGN